MAEYTNKKTQIVHCLEGFSLSVKHGNVQAHQERDRMKTEVNFWMLAREDSFVGGRGLGNGVWFGVSGSQATHGGSGGKWEPVGTADFILLVWVYWSGQKLKVANTMFTMWESHRDAVRDAVWDTVPGARHGFRTQEWWTHSPASFLVAMGFLWICSPFSIICHVVLLLYWDVFTPVCPISGFYHESILSNAFFAATEMVVSYLSLSLFIWFIIFIDFICCIIQWWGKKNEHLLIFIASFL